MIDDSSFGTFEAGGGSYSTEVLSSSFECRTIEPHLFSAVSRRVDRFATFSSCLSVSFDVGGVTGAHFGDWNLQKCSIIFRRKWAGRCPLPDLWNLHVGPFPVDVRLCITQFGHACLDESACSVSIDYSA